MLRLKIIACNANCSMKWHNRCKWLVIFAVKINWYTLYKDYNSIDCHWLINKEWLGFWVMKLSIENISPFTVFLHSTVLNLLKNVILKYPKPSSIPKYKNLFRSNAPQFKTQSITLISNTTCAENLIPIGGVYMRVCSKSIRNFVSL